jgi:2,5-dihydroxypyridine 5,6-dioxygenase
MGAALEGGARAMGVMQPFHVLHRLRGDADVVRRTKAGAARLEDAQEIRITSEAGTDLVMDKTGRRALANCGVADEPGTLTFWGAAMVETAQLEGTLEGTLVLDVGDLIFYMGRYIEEPVTITFREGKAVSFEGGFEAFLIRHFLESRGDEGSLMAGHTSWGTDPRALWEAQAIQFGEPAGGADAEAYYGNVQIEIGSNNDVNFRGENEANAHLGLCSLNSSLYLDDELIIDHGEFVPESWRK